MQLLVHMIIMLLWRISTEAEASSSEAQIAKPNCQTVCGDVSIPYPFGIGPNEDCYLDDWYEIDCKYSTSPHKPSLRLTKLEVLNIEIGGTLRVNNPVSFYSLVGKEVRLAPNLTGSPFVYSQESNRFTAVSCGFFARLKSDGHVIGGCMSRCNENTSGSNEGCTVINCCQTALPSYFSVISTDLQSEPEEISEKDPTFSDYNYAFLVDQAWFKHNVSSNFRAIKVMDSVPVVLEWGLSLDNMNSSLRKSFEKFIVEQWMSPMLNGSSKPPGNSTPFCIMFNVTSSTYNQSSFLCFCPRGFGGNPYLLQPCQDIDECKGPNPCWSPDPAKWDLSGAICENYSWGHSCYSNKTGVICQYFANGKLSCNKLMPPITSKRFKTILVGLGMGLGLLFLLISPWCAYKIIIKKIIDIKRKEKFYKRNGGLLLEKELSSGKVEKAKFFKSKELEKSTDNYNVDRILGYGGQGTVYKGMLADGRIVALKKSKKVDESKLSEFINEVVILSQINHRNVVKLLGCCLETEVPLLVYEFMPNGTLSQYIQGQIEEFPLTWEMRLRIATEVAGDLSYLHSAASFPIYHRDIKSMNILLDEKYRAKVADFGTSRSVAIDQTHLTTPINGTFGYLDPEYFQSSKFTEKSDVYSYGVVLVELLTGQKPVCTVTMTTQEDEEYRSLATCFINSMEEDRLVDILDDQVLKEGSETEIRVVANLARRCLNMNGRKRPTMREVTAELEAILMSTENSSTSIKADQQNHQGVEFGQNNTYEHCDAVST